MWRDGELDGSELGLAGGIVSVWLAIPGFGRLQQDFALAAGNRRRAVLREYGGQGCCAKDGGDS